MKVAIFGATGFSGRAILSETLSQQHQVVALVRSTSAVTIQSERLTLIEGSVLDSRAVARVVSGCDAVIQCLGVGGKGNSKPTTFLSDATRIIVDEMTSQGIPRLIVMSNVGAGDSAAFQPWVFSRVIMPLFMKWLKVIIDDKNRMEPIVMSSGLDWTLVRCPNIVDKEKTNHINATVDGRGLKLSVTLPDMAAFMVRQLTDSTFSHKAPCISN
ncbi:MAG: NAD-dependent epimerase/dehydratase family protein [Candidatus Kapabacteria bacterium]|nr:NAD-dependent epimerase/dehydratase family protein [Candidatus Kapabacteria bacterium]